MMDPYKGGDGSIQGRKQNGRGGLNDGYGDDEGTDPLAFLVWVKAKVTDEGHHTIDAHEPHPPSLASRCLLISVCSP